MATPTFEIPHNESKADQQRKEAISRAMYVAQLISNFVPKRSLKDIDKVIRGERKLVKQEYKKYFDATIQTEMKDFIANYFVS